MESRIVNYCSILRKHICKDYRQMFREQGQSMKYPFLTPGSDQYADVLWDWDSWLSDIALRQILAEVNDPEQTRRAFPYERGCVENFLNFSDMTGYVPILAGRGEYRKPDDILSSNMHKPCLAQHAAFLVKETGEGEWLREKFYFLQAFTNNYYNHHRHESTGLYFWQDDTAIGVDNDPCTYGRPPRSSASIYLNCLMYRELLAMAYLSQKLNLDEISTLFERDAAALKNAINEHCWDERDGFFYNVDLSVTKNIHPGQWGHGWGLHCGQPPHWSCLIQRIGVWSGFLALWAGVATPEQARRVVEEHYRNPKTFNAPAGVRTLSKMEKMYEVRASGNPSSWLGPVWGAANYLTFRGFVRYGYNDDATELAEKTIVLFGRDIERFGAMHEYYLPENGEPVLNRGFQNWNYLVLNMINWLEGKQPVEEF
jgi:putative isomerase